MDACDWTTRVKQRCARSVTPSQSGTDGETATVGGEMEVVIVRPPDDGGARFWLTIRLPGGEELDVQIARAQLLQQFDIDANESCTEIDLRSKNRRRSI